MVLSVEHGRKSDEIAHHEAQHSGTGSGLAAAGSPCNWVLEHGMERLGER
jgi:hypothetical protein